MKWYELCDQIPHSKFQSMIQNIENHLSSQQINKVLKQIDSLLDPNDIRKLRELQTVQAAKGGGFYGIIPPILADDFSIPIPSDPEHILQFLNFFANNQKQILQYMPSTSFSLEFGNIHSKDFNFEEIISCKPASNLKIILELDLFEQILHLFNNPDQKNLLLSKISKNPIVHELIKHRNGLGYVPGPEFCLDFYLYHLENAITDDPVINLWKLLHPWNFFDFADLWIHLEEYIRLQSTLSAHKVQLENYISSRLGGFIPKSSQITERVAFSVEWAIRGWATVKFAGLNIEYMKDNYSEIIKTITHEVFHRIQVNLLPKPKNIDSLHNDLSFDMLFEFTDLEQKEAKFNEVLGYIFLEGTASYVEKDSPPIPTQDDIDKAKIGLNLLTEIMQKLFLQEATRKDEAIFDEIDQLINQGLKSNGPFYSLGYYITWHLVSTHGYNMIKEALTSGWYHFYSKYFEDCKENKELIQFQPQLYTQIAQNEKIVINFLNVHKN